MKITQQENALKVEHEHGDDAIKKDSVFWFRLRSALKLQGKTVQRYPLNRHIPASTGQGLLEPKTNSVIYDPQYQVRDVAEEYKKIGVVHLAVMQMKTVYRVHINSTEPWDYTEREEAFRQARNIATAAGKNILVTEETVPAERPTR